MSTLDHLAFQPSAAERPAIWARVARGGMDLFRTWKNRQALILLTGLTDRELADIGLIRSDLAMVESIALRDRTSRLNTIVAERRSLEDAARRVS